MSKRTLQDLVQITVKNGEYQVASNSNNPIYKPREIVNVRPQGNKIDGRFSMYSMSMVEDAKDFHNINPATPRIYKEHIATIEKYFKKLSKFDSDKGIYTDGILDLNMMKSSFSINTAYYLDVQFEIPDWVNSKKFKLYDMCHNHHIGGPYGTSLANFEFRIFKIIPTEQQLERIKRLQETGSADADNLKNIQKQITSLEKQSEIIDAKRSVIAYNRYFKKQKIQV